MDFNIEFEKEEVLALQEIESLDEVGMEGWTTITTIFMIGWSTLSIGC